MSDVSDLIIPLGVVILGAYGIEKLFAGYKGPAGCGGTITQTCVGPVCFSSCTAADGGSTGSGGSGQGGGGSGGITPGTGGGSPDNPLAGPVVPGGVYGSICRMAVTQYTFWLHPECWPYWLWPQGYALGGAP